MIKKLLIANRGEIACRVIRTARRLGIQTIAVFSQADRHSQHVHMADESVYIGPAASKESYLNIERIIQAAKTNQVDAVHPGYGFLSENAQFAERLQQENIIFIGAPVQAIRMMGDKAQAKIGMKQAGIPLIPGFNNPRNDPSELLKEARNMEFPLLLKASAGGGGKGMRIVQQPHALEEAFESAAREARNSFGNDHMIVERYIANPRHVEVQIFFDQHQQGVYLFDRDCSLQRRYQKVIEEAPAPGLSDALHKALGETAVRAGAAVHYEGAGTIEFLLDSEYRFYFMEMNTRLQVEHPVTEMITGIDLVEWQIRIAEGKKLPLKQEKIPCKGHSFEARLYAEDPFENFKPVTGTIEHLSWPPENLNTRIETGIAAQDSITVWYDPMIAKMVTWGQDRNTALTALQHALNHTLISGLQTNRDFLIQLTHIESFKQGNVNTALIDDHYATLSALYKQQHYIALMVLAVYRHQKNQLIVGAWRLNSPTKSISLCTVDHGPTYTVSIQSAHDVSSVTINGTLFEQITQEVTHSDTGLVQLHTLWDHGHHQCTLVPSYLGYTLCSSDHIFKIAPVTYHTNHHKDSGCHAPMNGVITALKKKAGDTVQVDDIVVSMEAMKMEIHIKAPHAGIIEDILVHEGDAIEENTVLFALKEETSDVS